MNIRGQALAIYKPPFHFHRGYIYDANSAMVADQGGPGGQETVQGAVAARVRGWGRLGYMENGAALQDEIGQVVAEALNDFWAKATGEEA